jgi:hypothetical protein
MWAMKPSRISGVAGAQIHGHECRAVARVDAAADRERYVAPPAEPD